MLLYVTANEDWEEEEAFCEAVMILTVVSLYELNGNP